MFSIIAPASRTKGKLLSSFAMAIALAAGGVAGTAAFAPAAYAQDFSRDFVRAYQPVEELTKGEAPNWEGARSGFAGVEAAIETEDDRNAAGNLALQIGNTLNDRAYQRKGLRLMLQSGKTAPEQVGLFHYYLGNFALQEEDYAAARADLTQALAVGYIPEEAASDVMVDPRTQILQTYTFSDDTAGGLAYARSLISDAEVAGQKPAEQWIAMALQIAYDEENYADSTYFGAKLAANYPNARNWRNAILIVQDLGEFSDAESVDLYRLMFKQGAMSERRDYVSYIEALDPRLMSNEVAPALQATLDNGVYTAADEYYAAVKQVIDGRLESDRQSAAGVEAEGRNGDALDAFDSAEILYSLGNYAAAEELYGLSIERGSAHVDRDQLRVGISQAMQGKNAEAVASFGKVGGALAPVAQLWAAASGA